MELTLFLAQIFGITLIITSLSLLLERKLAMEVVEGLVNNRTLLYVLGILDLVFGLMVVLTHNNWEGDNVATIITLLGWLLLIKGVARMFVPTATIKKLYKRYNIEKMLPVFGGIYMIIGIYLVCAGFAPLF